MHRPRLRPAALLIAVLLAAAQVVVGSGAARAVTYRNNATAAHPYSNPVWWPLNASGTAIGCYHGNGPDCRNPLQHTVYAMDVAAPNNSNLPVHAMGAGVVHVEATGWRCHDSQSRGNWLYVDHGNGIRSEYGHLGRIYVHTGDFVTAQTVLATVGQSGYQGCATKPYVRYLWLGVRHGGSYYHFRSTYTCVNGRRVQWPEQLPTHRTDDWNQVPAHTTLPASDRRCTPTQPATPVKPGSRLARAGRGELRASTSQPRAVDAATATSFQLQEYHPSIHRWLDYANRRVGPATTTTTITGLPKGRAFRMRVWRANGVGWSAPSYWSTATVS